MPPQNNIEGVGIGVDLFDGASTLETLRAIRGEMMLIQQLSGRSSGASGNIYGPNQTELSQREANYRAEERIETEHINRMARIRAEGTRAISSSEINNLAQKRLRDAEVRSLTEARVRQIEAEDAKKEAELQERIATERLQRRARINATAQDPNIGSPEAVLSNRQQRGLFQKYRNDPARDDLTNQYRKQLAEETVAQREAISSKRRQDQEIIREETDRRETFRREMLDLQRRDLRQREADARRLREEEKNRLLDTYTNLGPNSSRGPVHLNPSKGFSSSTVLTAEEIELQRVRDYLRKGGDPAKYDKAGGGGPSGPKPPSGGSGGEEPLEEAVNGGGRRGLGQGLVGRFIAYQLISQATFGLIEYTKHSFEAAKATTEQANALRYATEAAGGNLEANRALAIQLQSFGANRTQSAEIVAQAARATYRHPEQTEQLARLATDIAASRGGGVQNATKVIEDIQEGRDRTYRELFNATPEDIYKQAAKKAVDARTSNFGGPRTITGINSRDYKTEAQQISAYVSALTEEEKEQLRLNFALSQAYRFQGDAIERTTTLAGKIDLVSVAFFNASANVGAFIADIKPVKDIIDQIAGATPDSVFTPPQLRQGGPRNTITDANVIEFGAESATSTRASTLAFISKATSFIADNITALNTAVNISRALDHVTGRITGTEGPGISDAEYNRIVAENTAKARQVRQREVLRKEGQLGYRAINPGEGDPSQYFSYQELTAKGLSAGDILKRYIEDVKPILKEGAKDLAEYNQQRAALVQSIAEGKTDRAALNTLDAQRDAKLIGSFKPKDYDSEALKREDERKAKEAQQKAKDNAEYTSALAKLREFRQGSFRVVDETASKIAGPDNPYIKVLSDQATAAERMHQQWGFLGKDIEAYELKLEQAASNKAINKLEFGSYATASNLRGQAASELAQRTGPGLSRAESDYLAIQSAIVDRAVQIPQLWAEAATVLGRNSEVAIADRLNLIAGAFGVAGPRLRNVYGQDITPDGTRRNVYGQSLGGTFDVEPRRNVYGQRLEEPEVAQMFANIGAGQSPEVQRSLRKSFADTILGAFQGFTPQQIRASGFQDVYLGAVNQQRGSLQDNIFEAQRKAQYGAAEDQRLNVQLRQDEEFRRSQIARGRPSDEVGRESDKLLLSRTQGINPKDLTYQQFTDRSAALRREAERAIKDQDEAKQAVKDGLDIQANMLEQLDQIRAAIIGGDMTLAIKINNNTQANVDTTALENAHPKDGTFKSTNLGTENLGADALKKYQRFGKREQ